MRLGDLPVPPEAEERSLRVVKDAFAARVPNPRRRRVGRSLPAALVAVVAAVAVSTVAVRASGGSVVNTVRDALGVRNAAPQLTRLPAPGRLLVNSSSGPWIVDADGAKRHLGTAGFTQASWSPHGLFEIAVLHGRELAAIDPKGRIRWTLARGRVNDARWSGDGYRIAYRSGAALRVVAGDGTGDHLLAPRSAAAAPAWNGVSHQLAYADPRGRIHLVDADTGAALWTSLPGPAPTQIAWEPGGRQIVAVGTRTVRILRARDGSRFKQIALPDGVHRLAISPTGPAVVTTRSASGQTAIVLIHPQHPWLAPRTIFRGAGRFNGLAWSPDGTWLLASWAGADQWVFINIGIRSGAIKRVQAVSSIARQFGVREAPTLAGWCCSAGLPPTP
jgi:hypothetical protein